MADELGLPTVGWSLDDVAAEDTGWGVFRVEPVRVLTRRGVSGPADAVRFAAAEDMCSGHANGRTSQGPTQGDNATANSPLDGGRKQI